MYAVNLMDWHAHQHDFCLKIALLGKVADKADQTVDAEPGRVDGMALPFTCPDEQAAATIAIIRMHYPRHRLRCYQGNGRTWRRL